VGQLFLVNPDGGTANFGGFVEVFVVNSESLTVERKAVLNAKLAALIEAENRLATAAKEENEFTEFFRIDVKKRSDASATETDLLEKARTLGRDIEAGREQAKRLSELRDIETRAKEIRVEANRDFIDAWGAIIEHAVGSAKTDAGGSFEVFIEPGHALCAYANREKAGRFEHFVWVI
jgi:hypothetical protein